MLLFTTTRKSGYRNAKLMTNPSAVLPLVLAESSILSPLAKGLGSWQAPLKASQVPKLGWNLLQEDLSLPTAILDQERLAHNLAWMQEFADAYGAKLAPHGKTTMAPKLFSRQMQAGAWGMTLATAQQTRVGYEHGIRRVLMANQLVGRQNMETISRLLEDRDFEYFCLVDSAELVEILAQFFHPRGQRLNVLLELGVEGGRTGVRNAQQLQALLAAVSSSKESVRLSGIEIFEGLLSEENLIRQLLKRAVAVTKELARSERFERSPLILSGAGSAWYDVVAEVFQADFPSKVEVILRPGCYLTHDCGVYRNAQSRILSSNPVAQKMAPGLLPVLQIWAYVQSVPEQNLAIVGFGKRDAAFDAGLPMPSLHFRPGQAKPTRAPEEWKIIRMWDQHASLEMPGGADIRLGDMIGFDISHPCLTFDKWRYLPLVDPAYKVIDLVETFF
jgi:D-serine dehydratase